ncbi:hypothetical protein AYI68_g5284 [Smittium mucronatum]|uniref:Uncharacterized protein n=1 Tax=Smittium mucronatum TaxID=133383 RepID=A0A1R0GUP7_9FUNG|nr:hypothetical protein AYI68_g5284 [Smittium mucronatum]
MGLTSKDIPSLNPENVNKLLIASPELVGSISMSKISLLDKSSPKLKFCMDGATPESWRLSIFDSTPPCLKKLRGFDTCESRFE